MGDRIRALKLFERAYQCQQSGDHAGAIALYQASLVEHPTAEAHTFLGWVYSFDGRYAEAIIECKRAIALDPEFGNPYNDIGVYLVAQGRDDEAIPWLEEAQRAPRYDARHYPHANLARIYERRGDLLRAAAEFGRALEREAGYRPALEGLRRVQRRVN